ncbi:MAG: leucine-rich repeat domain-containing protein [Deltaproteobacteria bacterium]|nr:leucine-rich repeat domain-containing protein [Deltaproteobacteria bacterium]
MRAIILVFCCSAWALCEGFVPICERSRPVKELLESVTLVGCSEIQLSDRLKIMSLNFSTIEPGELRAGDFSGLPNLEYLFIYGFRLRALPKRVFAFLPKLRWLDLDDNALESFSLPETCGDCEIAYLGLRRNGLGSVDVTGATNASLNGNRLDEVGKIRGLETVTSIDLGSNGITHLDLRSFRNLFVVDLGHNPIQEQSHVQLPNTLTKLVFSGTRISRFSNSVWETPRLVRLELGFDNLESFQCPSHEAFRTLYLQKTKLDILDADLFKSCPKLTYLNLSNHEDTRIHPQAFRELAELETFVLSDSKLQNLPEGLLQLNRKLRMISLWGNRFSRDLNDFLPNVSIRLLRLQGNRFEFLPAWFGKVRFSRNAEEQYSSYGLQLKENRLNDGSRRWLKKTFEYLGADLELD